MSNETTPPVTPASYVFNSLTDLQYNDTKLKELLIDSGASTWLIGGIGQLKVLKQLNNSIQPNKNTARSANFIFGIRSVALIGSVDLDTLLGLITFYIVPVNTLFLLYLAKINKHRAFFNIITNQVI